MCNLECPRCRVPSDLECGTPNLVCLPVDREETFFTSQIEVDLNFPYHYNLVEIYQYYEVLPN